MTTTFKWHHQLFALACCICGLIWPVSAVECEIEDGFSRLMERLHSGVCTQVELSYAPKSQVQDVLKELPRASMLRELDLSHASLDDADLAFLAAQLEHFPHLVDLDLSSNQFSQAGLEALAKMLRKNVPPRLRELELAHNHIDDAAAHVLFFALENNTVLVDLDLSYNDLTDEAALAAEEVLVSPTGALRELNLRGNMLSVQAVAMLDELRKPDPALNLPPLRMDLHNQRPRPPHPSAQTPSHIKARAAHAVPDPVPRRRTQPLYHNADSPMDWDETRVAQWVQGVSGHFARYAEGFIKNAVSGRMLRDMTDDDLRALGVENRFHRQRLLDEARAMFAHVQSASDSA